MVQEVRVPSADNNFIQSQTRWSSAVYTNILQGMPAPRGLAHLRGMQPLRGLFGYRRSLSSCTGLPSSVPKGIWAADVLLCKERVNFLLQGDLYKDPRHPIYNFIFTYYFSMNAKCLTHYSPGLDVALADAVTASSDLPLAPCSWTNCYNEYGTYLLDSSKIVFTKPKLKAMAKVLKLLETIDSRPPSLRCYGLHEWAMLYTRTSENSSSPPHLSSLSATELGPATALGSASPVSKFQNLKLRVSEDTLRKVLKPEGSIMSPLRCTHYDAIRFFTPDAKELNSIESPIPSR